MVPGSAMTVRQDWPFTVAETTYGEWPAAAPPGAHCTQEPDGPAHSTRAHPLRPGSLRAICKTWVQAWPPFWLRYTIPDAPANHPWDASLKHTDCGSCGLFRFVHERPPSFETTTVPPLMGIRTPCMINGALPPAIPHPCVALTK